jgi:hypothetical protein
MFCEPGLVFEGVGSRFLVLRARTHFRRYRGRRVPFSCYPRPDTFSAVTRATGPVFLLCSHRLVFGRTEGVGSRFLVLRARTRFGRSEGVGSRFLVLRALTHFRRYRERRVPFECFGRVDSFSYYAHPDAFSAVPRASGPVFMFCVPGLIFGRNDGAGYRFHVLRARTRFRG